MCILVHSLLPLFYSIHFSLTLSLSLFVFILKMHIVNLCVVSIWFRFIVFSFVENCSNCNSSRNQNVLLVVLWFVVCWSLAHARSLIVLQYDFISSCFFHDMRSIQQPEGFVFDSTRFCTSNTITYNFLGVSFFFFSILFFVSLLTISHPTKPFAYTFNLFWFFVFCSMCVSVSVYGCVCYDVIFRLHLVYLHVCLFMLCANLLYGDHFYSIVPIRSE